MCGSFWWLGPAGWGQECPGEGIPAELELDSAPWQLPHTAPGGQGVALVPPGPCPGAATAAQGCQRDIPEGHPVCHPCSWCDIPTASVTLSVTPSSPPVTRPQPPAPGVINGINCIKILNLLLCGSWIISAALSRVKVTARNKTFASLAFFITFNVLSFFFL